MSAPAHKVAVECGWAVCGFAGWAASAVTPDTVAHFTLYGGAAIVGWRLFLAFLEALGIQYPRRPIWTWGRRNGRD